MKINKYFYLHEFVPRKVYKDLGDRSYLVMDPKMFNIAYYLRERFGPTIINDWYWGGKRQYSGFRPQWATVGSLYSQHRFGRAIDAVFREVTAEEVREDIKNKPLFWHDKLGIRRIEKDTSHLHVDIFKPRNSRGIVWINKPTK